VEAGNQVTLFLVQNAVLAARPSAQVPQLQALIGSGISNAVNYAPGLSIGGWKQTLAPRMDNDVLDLIEKRKIPVFVIEEDLAMRGIEPGEPVPGVQLMTSAMLPKRMAECEIVSHW
jgi:hypothetical protein